MDKVNLAQKFSLFSDYFSPKIVGELNDFHVKLVKLQGEFVWHHHDVEDELFFVVKGALKDGACAKTESSARSSFILASSSSSRTGLSTVLRLMRRRTSCCSNRRAR